MPRQSDPPQDHDSVTTLGAEQWRVAKPGDIEPRNDRADGSVRRQHGERFARRVARQIPPELGALRTASPTVGALRPGLPCGIRAAPHPRTADPTREEQTLVTTQERRCRRYFRIARCS